MHSVLVCRKVAAAVPPRPGPVAHRPSVAFATSSSCRSISIASIACPGGMTTAAPMDPAGVCPRAGVRSTGPSLASQQPVQPWSLWNCLTKSRSACSPIPAVTRRSSTGPSAVNVLSNRFRFCPASSVTRHGTANPAQAATVAEVLMIEVGSSGQVDGATPARRPPAQPPDGAVAGTCGGGTRAPFACAAFSTSSRCRPISSSCSCCCRPRLACSAYAPTPNAAPNSKTPTTTVPNVHLPVERDSIGNP